MAPTVRVGPRPAVAINRRAAELAETGLSACLRALRRTSRRPLERRAVGIGRVGGGEDRDLGLVRLVAQRAQQIHGAGQGELRRAEAGHEIAAAQPPTLFHRSQHGIHAREAAGDQLDGQRFARQHAVTGEQLLRDGGDPSGRAARWQA